MAIASGGGNGGEEMTRTVNAVFRNTTPTPLRFIGTNETALCVRVFSEWHVKNHRSQATHIQTVSRRIHRAGKNRNHLPQEPVRQTSICLRRIHKGKKSIVRNEKSFVTFFKKRGFHLFIFFIP